MDADALASRLRASFLEELGEHVRALNRDALALEKDPAGDTAAERLKTLFRTAHSLKGAARAVNVQPIEAACHHLEEILAGVQSGGRPIGPDLFSLLLAAADAIEQAGACLRADQEVSGGRLATLLPRLEAAATGAQPASRRPPAALPPWAPAVPAAGPGLVRLRAERVDALLAGSGELLVACRRMEARPRDVATLRETVGSWTTEWRRAERALRALLRAGGTAPVPRPLELTLSRTGERLRRLDTDLERLAAAVTADVRQLERAAGPLGDDIRRIRMLPFAEACEGLERMVRDLAQASGKAVDLVVDGGQVELDRSILEGLKDPLRHLVRNAVDHGVEPPEARRAAGKAPRARITVAAALRGAQVEVVVADDGGGLDLEGLREQARKRGLPEPANQHQLAGLIFEPGLSTARIVTDVSGRGVGLDVVKSRLESLHGRVDLAAAGGHGTRFVLTVPLTLTTLRAGLVTAAGQVFAVPGTNVAAVLRVPPGDIRSVGGRGTLALGGAPIPVTTLAETLGLRPGYSAPQHDKVPALVLAAGEKRVAFLVDEVLAEQEITIKSLGDRVRGVRAISGATILPSGCIALVLNPAHLVASAEGGVRAGALAPAPPAAAPAKKRVLLVDDSITTRTLERTVLEAAGYDVTVAADGDTAWALLREHGADIVVSDVEMPRMDGFALTEAVRSSERFRELPVVLVTGRESEWDRARGMRAGADAYLVKSAFDQEAFLATIAQLL